MIINAIIKRSETDLATTEIIIGKEIRTFNEILMYLTGEMDIGKLDKINNVKVQIKSIKVIN